MSEWQPIETAPKDGAEVLLTDVSQWPIVVCDAWTRNGWSRWYDVTDWGYPTHWMPLPPPPKTPEGK